MKSPACLCISIHVARFIETPSQASRGMIRLQAKERLAWNCSSQPLNLTNPAPSGGSNDAYNACELDSFCSNTAARYNKMFGNPNMDNRRSSCNGCAGSTHIPSTRSPGIRSRNDIRDSRSRFRRLRPRSKPERQLVLLEPEPVRLLPMEVKEVFSYHPPILNFPLVCVFAAHVKIALSPFYLIRIPTMSRFLSQTKIRRKSDL